MKIIKYNQYIIVKKKLKVLVTIYFFYSRFRKNVVIYANFKKSVHIFRRLNYERISKLKTLATYQSGLNQREIKGHDI
jgi:hypothetical protein